MNRMCSKFSVGVPYMFPHRINLIFAIDGDGRVCIHLSSIICCASKRLSGYAHGTGELLKAVAIIDSHMFLWMNE